MRLAKVILENVDFDSRREDLLRRSHDFYNLNKYSDKLSFEERKDLVDILDEIYGQALSPFRSIKGSYADIKVESITDSEIVISIVAGTSKDKDKEEERLTLDRNTMLIKDVSNVRL